MLIFFYDGKIYSWTNEDEDFGISEITNLLKYLGYKVKVEENY